MEDFSEKWDPTVLLEVLFYALPIGVCITDENGDFVYVNHAYCRLYGYRQSELLGRHFTVVVPKNNHNQLNAIHEGFINDDQDELPAVWEVLKKDGSRITISATARKFEGLAGKKFKVTTVTDITENLRLKKMREDAERVVRHDLKSPLNAVIGFSRLLSESQNLDESQREFLHYIHESGQTMLGMIDYSMDWFRMEEGSYRIQADSCDLERILSETSKQFETALARKSLSLSLETESSGAPYRVTGEKRLLVALFSNLIKNAIEASPPGEQVRIRLRHEKQACCVCIHNQGVIPASIRDCFFERYVTSGKQGGTGLGTYSARLIAGTHGGEIRFETAVETGTWLIVTLPY